MIKKETLSSGNELPDFYLICSNLLGNEDFCSSVSGKYIKTMRQQFNQAKGNTVELARCMRELLAMSEIIRISNQFRYHPNLNEVRECISKGNGYNGYIVLRSVSDAYNEQINAVNLFINSEESKARLGKISESVKQAGGNILLFQK